MARWVKIASLLFKSEHLRGTAGAREAVLDELDRSLEATAGQDVDLVVVSEGVESLGQSMDQAERVHEPGPVLQRYCDYARAEGCTVAGSIKLAEGEHVYNAIVYVGPTGEVLGDYRKTFLTYGELERGFTPGAGAVVVDTPAGRLGGAICFDLNFTELCEQYEPLQPDILTFASMYHGGLMQQVWAYRCRSYFASALPFHGGGVLDPFGRPCALTDCYTSIAMAPVNLDRALVHLDLNRGKFLDIRRKYTHEVVVDIPPNVGSAMITSCSDRLTAMDVVREFDLLLLDDYLERSRNENAAGRPA